MKTLSTLALVLAATCAPAIAAGPASGQEPKKQAAGKNEQKKAKAASKAEPVPDLAHMHAVDYDCDLGDKLTIYKAPGDDGQIALQWKKRTHRMTRMPTSTGAERFEDADNGLVWIGIPAKGMLLDSKKGRQLANECRNEQQKKQLAQN